MTRNIFPSFMNIFFPELLSKHTYSLLHVLIEIHDEKHISLILYGSFRSAVMTVSFPLGNPGFRKHGKLNQHGAAFYYLVQLQ